MRGRAGLALWALGLTLWAGCTVRSLEPPPPPVQALPPIGELAQRGFFATDPFADARRALAERAASRERRFREAYEPGSLWRYLRVEQGDIERGAVAIPTLLDIGRELFAVDFTVAQGLGNGLAARKSTLAGGLPAPNLRHVEHGEFGGPDATRCLACHFVGGEGGGGFRSDNAFLAGDGVHPASALERNPPALAGAGLLQLVAQEMTAELQATLRRAQEAQDGVAVPLVAKGVSFGVLRLSRSGQVDPAGLRGIGPDLVVRPFGRKGTTATLREAIEDQLQRHLGVQPEGWLSDPRRRGDAALLGDGPDADDPDGDGVRREATAGMVTALSTYLTALAPPVEQAPEEPSFLLRASRGAEHFVAVGCAGCHVPALKLQATTLCLGPAQGGARAAGPCFDLGSLLRGPGQSQPTLEVRLFSDLRRHDMGDALAEPRAYRGAPGRQWLTAPLWGLSASAPYLHDGRAGNLPAAIAAHDGEARASREAYQKLPSLEQGALLLYLTELDRPHHLEFKR